MSEPSSSERLKRNISLVHLVGIEIGQSIGAGIFALTGLGLARTGPSLPLAFLAAAVPVGLSMPVLAMLGSGHPISGDTYFYAARFFSPVASFTGVWAYLLLVAEDGLLPRGLAAVNRRFGTPHPANSMSYQ